MSSGPEWETRHSEFVTVGDRATLGQINEIISALGFAAKQYSSKRGFLNQIFGKQSNGDLARIAQSTEILAKNIQRNSNAKPGTDERKELGQHLVYAVSLLKRSNSEQGVVEGLMNTIANKVMGVAPEQPKYKVGQRVKYETSLHQPTWEDGVTGVGVITDYKNGHYMINGKPINHFDIKGVVEQGVLK